MFQPRLRIPQMFQMFSACQADAGVGHTAPNNAFSTSTGRNAVRRLRFRGCVCGGCAVPGTVATIGESHGASPHHRQQELFVLVVAAMAGPQGRGHSVRGNRHSDLCSGQQGKIFGTLAGRQSPDPAGRRRDGVGVASNPGIPGRTISRRRPVAKRSGARAPTPAPLRAKCMRDFSRCGANAR